MRKFAQTLFRSASLTFFNQLKLKSSNLNGQKVLLASTLAAYGLWFATTKVYNTEFMTVETQDNLQEGEVRELKVGPKDEDTILVISYQGNVYATQSKCSHFGFNLAKGLLIGDKIICPLHNAGFKITTGHEEQGPVFGGLKTFKVERSNGKITVKVPKDGWDAQPVREYEVKQFNKNKNYVIVGGGAAALAAIDSLRQNGYDGLITVISKETCNFIVILRPSIRQNSVKQGQRRHKGPWPNQKPRMVSKERRRIRYRDHSRWN
jgi:nitrite reductase/ring-hydroxylating ferredoxin subunit